MSPPAWWRRVDDDVGRQVAAPHCLDRRRGRRLGIQPDRLDQAEEALALLAGDDRLQERRRLGGIAGAQRLVQPGGVEQEAFGAPAFDRRHQDVAGMGAGAAGLQLARQHRH
ncbi:MAG: hypothetical protein WDN06_17045 [Asticcacaulis sp.]